MKQIIKTTDIPSDQSQMLKKGMKAVTKELNKYSYNVAVNIAHSLFLKMVYYRYSNKEERGEMMKMFEEAKDKTFSAWDEMREAEDDIKDG